MIRQLAIMLAAFVLGTAVAAAVGAVSFGVALGVGQVCFAAALAWVLLADWGLGGAPGEQQLGELQVERSRHLQVLGRRRVN
jgi:hypothetical protein